jgi:site-specific recombinase XerD
MTLSETTRENEKIIWTTLDREELIEAYRTHIAPAMEDAGMDPETDRPSHEWLSNQGFRGLIYALRKYHDRTFGEFWAEDLNLESQDSDQYEWGIEHSETIALLESYLESRRSRGNLADSSVETLRYRLAQYVRAYAEENAGWDLLSPVRPDSETPVYEATDAAWAAFDRLDATLRPQTMRRVHEAVDGWYAHLVRRKRAAINPVAGLEDEYSWNREPNAGTTANPALDPRHVQSLYDAAVDTEDKLLIIALCGWGLRSGEVASIHHSQLHLDSDAVETPFIAFEERKNGPGEVSILFGRDVAAQRIADLSDREDWNGYLYPSKRSATGHITRQTVLNRFDSLVEGADIPAEINGRKPVPQMARRFWYDAYSATQEELIAEVGEIAEEQGSASAGVVMRNYLSPERRRALRRDAMRARLSAAFDA